MNRVYLCDSCGKPITDSEGRIKYVLASGEKKASTWSYARKQKILKTTCVACYENLFGRKILRL